VIARVALNDALGTISSPGIGPATSALVAPQRVCQRRISGAVTKSGTPLKASRTARPILLSLVGAPPLLTTQTDGYPGTGTRKRPAAEHRAAPREPHMHTPPPNGRSIAAHMSIDPQPTRRGILGGVVRVARDG